MSETPTSKTTTSPITTHVLDVSIGTVEGDWRMARAWLRGQLGGDAAP